MKGEIPRARKLYRAGKYTRVIRLLEPEVFKFRGSFDYYYLLGMSCLRSGDAGGARTYLDRSLSIKPHDTSALAGLAVVHLKRYEIADAIQCYLDIIESEPNHRLARRGLRLLRRNVDRNRLAPIIDSGKVDSLLPRERSYRWLVVLVVVLVVLAGAAGAYLRWGDLLHTPTRNQTVEALTLRRIENLTGETSDHVMSEDEIEDTFALAKQYFSEYRDNLAMREINRLLRSNASESVKEQARTIAQFISPPDFLSITDPFPYEEVRRDPTLYDSTYVIWRGRSSNVDIGDNRITFDLLVGYETSRILEGVVPVIFDHAISIDNGIPLEVLAKVVSTLDEIALRGIAIHKLKDE